MPLLDTQKITDDLVAAGVNAPQARIFASKMEEAAHVIRGDLATKADVQATQRNIDALGGKFDAVAKGLQSEIQLVRSELRGDIKDMINRFTFIMVALLGTAIAILKVWR
jgi:hypothetical protein